MSTITVKHPNGYVGIMYGLNSLKVYYRGKEVLHTSSRAIHTASELYVFLENFPKLEVITGDR